MPQRIDWASVTLHTPDTGRESSYAIRNADKSEGCGSAARPVEEALNERVATISERVRLKTTNVEAHTAHPQFFFHLAVGSSSSRSKRAT